MRELVGEFGSHLKIVSRALDTRVVQRGNTLMIEGPPDVADAAERVLRQLYDYVGKGHPVRASDVSQALRVLQANPDANVAELFSQAILITANNKTIAPRTPGQSRYLEALRDGRIVFGIGPAGTGKTYLAVAAAVAALKAGDGERIILTRPAVEAGEKLGFLPGDLTETVDPYLRPLFDGLHDMLGVERVERLLEKRVIEIAPLAFMRGRTLEAAAVVLDEAQNTTAEQMRMFLTRMGVASRLAITGDVTQIDLPRGRRSGLRHARAILGGIDGIRFVDFGPEDVVRHPLVAAIIEAYARDDADRQRALEER